MNSSSSHYNEDLFREEAIPFVIYNSELRSKCHDQSESNLRI
jgi:hypothetical protein